MSKHSNDINEERSPASDRKVSFQGSVKDEDLKTTSTVAFADILEERKIRENFLSESRANIHSMGSSGPNSASGSGQELHSNERRKSSGVDKQKDPDDAASKLTSRSAPHGSLLYQNEMVSDINRTGRSSLPETNMRVATPTEELMKQKMNKLMKSQLDESKDAQPIDGYEELRSGSLQKSAECEVEESNILKPTDKAAVPRSKSQDKSWESERVEESRRSRSEPLEKSGELPEKFRLSQSVDDSKRPRSLPLEDFKELQKAQDDKMSQPMEGHRKSLSKSLEKFKELQDVVEESRRSRSESLEESGKLSNNEESRMSQTLEDSRKSRSESLEKSDENNKEEESTKSLFLEDSLKESIEESIKEIASEELNDRKAKAYRNYEWETVCYVTELEADRDDRPLEDEEGLGLTDGVMTPDNLKPLPKRAVKFKPPLRKDKKDASKRSSGHISTSNVSQFAEVLSNKLSSYTREEDKTPLTPRTTSMNPDDPSPDQNTVCMETTSKLLEGELKRQRLKESLLNSNNTKPSMRQSEPQRKVSLEDEEKLARNKQRHTFSNFPSENIQQPIETNEGKNDSSPNKEEIAVDRPSRNSKSKVLEPSSGIQYNDTCERKPRNRDQHYNTNSHSDRDADTMDCFSSKRQVLRDQQSLYGAPSINKVFALSNASNDSLITDKLIEKLNCLSYRDFTRIQCYKPSSPSANAKHIMKKTAVINNLDGRKSGISVNVRPTDQFPNYRKHRKLLCKATTTPLPSGEVSQVSSLAVKTATSGQNESDSTEPTSEEHANENTGERENASSSSQGRRASSSRRLSSTPNEQPDAFGIQAHQVVFSPHSARRTSVDYRDNRSDDDSSRSTGRRRSIVPPGDEEGNRSSVRRRSILSPDDEGVSRLSGRRRSVTPRAEDEQDATARRTEPKIDVSVTGRKVLQAEKSATASSEEQAKPVFDENSVVMENPSLSSKTVLEGASVQAHATADHHERKDADNFVKVEVETVAAPEQGIEISMSSDLPVTSLLPEGETRVATDSSQLLERPVSGSGPTSEVHSASEQFSTSEYTATSGDFSTTATSGGFSTDDETGGRKSRRKSSRRKRRRSSRRRKSSKKRRSRKRSRPSSGTPKKGRSKGSIPFADIPPPPVVNINRGEFAVAMKSYNELCYQMEENAKRIELEKLEQQEPPYEEEEIVWDTSGYEMEDEATADEGEFTDEEQIVDPKTLADVVRRSLERAGHYTVPDEMRRKSRETTQKAAKVLEPADGEPKMRIIRRVKTDRGEEQPSVGVEKIEMELEHTDLDETSGMEGETTAEDSSVETSGRKKNRFYFSEEVLAQIRDSPRGSLDDNRPGGARRKGEKTKEEEQQEEEDAEYRAYAKALRTKGEFKMPGMMDKKQLKDTLKEKEKLAEGNASEESIVEEEPPKKKFFYQDTTAKDWHAEKILREEREKAKAAGIDPMASVPREEAIEMMDASELFALIKSESTLELEKKQREETRLRVAAETAEKMSYDFIIFGLEEIAAEEERFYNEGGDWGAKLLGSEFQDEQSKSLHGTLSDERFTSAMSDLATIDTKTRRTMSTISGDSNFSSEVSSQFSLEDKMVTSNLKGEMWKTERAESSEENKVERRHTFSSIRTMEPISHDLKKHSLDQKLQVVENIGSLKKTPIDKLAMFLSPLVSDIEHKKKRVAHTDSSDEEAGKLVMEESIQEVRLPSKVSTSSSSKYDTSETSDESDESLVRRSYHARPEKEETYVSKLSTHQFEGFQFIFSRINKSTLGGITSKKLLKAFDEYLPDERMIFDEAEIIVMEVDRNQSGKIEFDDFIFTITKGNSFKKILPEQDFQYLEAEIRIWDDITEAKYNFKSKDEEEDEEEEGYVRYLDMFFKLVQAIIKKFVLRDVRIFYFNVITKLNDIAIQSWLAEKGGSKGPSRKKKKRYKKMLQMETSRQHKHLAKDMRKNLPLDKQARRETIAFRKLLQKRQPEYPNMKLMLRTGAKPGSTTSNAASLMMVSKDGENINQVNQAPQRCKKEAADQTATGLYSTMLKLQNRPQSAPVSGAPRPPIQQRAASARKTVKGPRRLVPVVEEPSIKEGDFPTFMPPGKILLTSSIDDVTDVKRKAAATKENYFGYLRKSTYAKARHILDQMKYDTTQRRFTMHYDYGSNRKNFYMATTGTLLPKPNWSPVLPHEAKPREPIIINLSTPILPHEFRPPKTAWS